MWCNKPAIRVRALGRLLPFVAAAALGACAASNGPQPLTPNERYAIQVSQAPDQVALAPHGYLSNGQKGALAAFVTRWRASDGGDVVVQAPANASDRAAARRTADATIAYLRQLGVPGPALREAGYDAADPQAAPILATFTRYEAHGPDCSHTWDDLADSSSNNSSRHFGCATTANFAAQIANPRHLIAPAELDPADNNRREVVLGKYRQGQVTSSAKDDQASGAISSAVH